MIKSHHIKKDLNWPLLIREALNCGSANMYAENTSEVSHHEPEGLTSREVIHLIQRIDTEIIGTDIVEYNPNRDFQNMTAFLATKMMKEILGEML